ncbi:MAG: hypothetical protein IPN97_04565 [Saprospiraceae bacterium]|nr:hypothetical protein [Saprospiraceae bacterium]
MIPNEVKAKILKIHQNHVFKRVWPQFEYLVENNIEVPDEILRKVIYGWGNMGYSSDISLSRALINLSMINKESILECGSGISTLIVGVIARKNKIELHSLENNLEWYNKMSELCKKLNLITTHIHYVPLVKYEDFDWYDIEKINLPNNLSLVLCDGPPAQTRGGRIGLLPVCNKYFVRKCKIIMDDICRQDERLIIDSWKKEYDFKNVA